MNVMLSRIFRGSILLATALVPTLEAAGQGPLGSSGNAAYTGTYPNAPAYYDEPFVGYQSQSAYQTATQRNAAATVLEDNIGYSLRAPFGPRLGFDGIFGDRRGIEGNDYTVFAFLPWHIDPNRNVLFANMRGTVTDLGDFVANLGVGQRIYLEDFNRILGWSAWYDMDDTRNQYYTRAGVQLEYLGRYLEIRGGADIVLNDTSQVLRSGFTSAPPFFRGNNVLFNFASTQEVAYDQGYIEAGGPMPYLGRYGVNAYGGAYYAWNEDADETLGWTLRVSADLTRDVQVGMRHTSDDIFGQNTSANVTLSFPNGGIKQVFRSSRTIVRGQTPNSRETNQVINLRPGSVASLMGSNVVRDGRLPVNISTNISALNAIDPVTGLPVCVTHVDPNAAALGSGTFEDPFRTLETARLTNDGSCRIIRVVPRGDGTNTNLAVTDTFALFTNQRLLGSSFPHQFETTRGIFDLPGFTGPGAGPLITNSSGGDVIRLGNNTEVSGVRIDGATTGNGIVGSPVDFNVNRNVITNSLNGVMLTNATGTGRVTENDVSSNINNGVVINNPAGGVLDLTYTDNNTNNNGADGTVISVTNGTLQGTIANNSATGNTGNGFTLNTDGSTIDFRDAPLGRTVVNNQFGGNMGDGFRVNSTNGSTVAMRFQDNDFGGTNLVGGGNAMSGLRLVADSGWHVIDVGGPSATDGNRFLSNLGTAAQFDLTGTADMSLLFQRNIIGIAVSAPIPGSLIRGGFDGMNLPANDDLSTGLIPIGFNANFFGTMFSDLFVNNNGNVTFGTALGTFTPFPIVTNGIPIIAPFFADVDTRSGNIVTFGQGTAGGRQAFGVNYIDVEHFSQGQPTNSFQLVLIDRSDIGAGDFDIEFNYDRILWEAGTASGSDAQGLGGSSARAGFSNGGANAFELAGSGINGAFLDSGPAATSLVNNSLNSTVLGRYLFEARNGGVNSGGSIPTGPAVDGLQINTAGNSVVKRAIIDQNQFASFTGTAIHVQSNTGSNVDDLRITNNNIRSIGRDGIRLAADTLATINLTSMMNNTVTGIGSNGFEAEATGAGVINIANVSGNTFSGNNENGAFIRANGIGSVVAGGIGVNGAAINLFEENVGYGINIEASSGGSILGPGSTGNFTIVNSQIGSMGRGNAMGGINAVADSNIMPPSNSLLNLTIGGPATGDGNTIVNNTDSGISFLTRTFAQGTVLIQNNVVSNTIDNGLTNGPNDPMGDGILLDRADTSLLTAMVLNNMSLNNTNDGLRVLSRGDDPTNAAQPMTGTPNVVTFNSNTFTGNGRNGASFEIQADSVLVGNGMLNTITGNMANGVNITTTGDAGFGNPAVGTLSVLDGNNISMNGGHGVGVTSSNSSRVFLSIQSSDAVGRTTIMDNTLNGIAINHTSDANSNIIIQSDPLVANTAFRTLITNNGDSTAMGGNGIQIDNANAASVFTVQRTDITSNNAGAMGENGNGLELNVTGGTPTFNIGSPIAAGAITTLGLGNVVQGNADDALEIGITGGSPIFNVAQNTFGARIGELAGGNMGHGINVGATGTNNAPVLTFLDNVITRNNGRGANILVTGNLGSRFGGGVAQFIFDNGGTGGNVISSNGLEGIFYMADPQIAQDRTVTLSNNLVGAPFNLTPAQWAGFINAAPPGNYDSNFRNLTTVNDTFLAVRNSTIQNNGTRNVDSDGVGGVDGDGVYIRVGTSAYVAADIQGITTGGNLLDDFRTDSFISAANAGSTNRTGMNMNDIIVLKDTAQLDLRFGVVGNINTGNQVNVTSAGALHTNDALTGNVFAALFQVDDGGNLNALNEFVQFGPPEQNLQGLLGAFSLGGYGLRGAADPLFPNVLFPVSNPPGVPPAPFLP